MSVVNVNKEIQEQQMNIVRKMRQGILSLIWLTPSFSFSSTAEGLLCGFAGAIGDKPGERHKGGATRAEEVHAAAQGAHGELPESGVHNEEATQEEGYAREYRKGAQGKKTLIS